MQYFARIASGTVAEIITIPDGAELSAMFHPSIVAALVSCPESVAVGYLYADGVFTAPSPTVETLSDAQISACNSLMTSLDQFVLYLPSGMPRYSVNFNFSTTMFAIKNGLTTAPIPALTAWMAAVQTAYATQEAAIMACTTVAEVEAIDTSVEWFETRYGVSGTVSADPNVTLKDLAG